MRVLALIVLLAACASTTPPTDPTTTTTSSPSADCIDVWDAYVAEWNTLTDDERDAYDERANEELGTYDGWRLFATENGYPLTYEELCG